MDVNFTVMLKTLKMNGIIGERAKQAKRSQVCSIKNRYIYMYPVLGNLPIHADNFFPDLLIKA